MLVEEFQSVGSNLDAWLLFLEILFLGAAIVFFIINLFEDKNDTYFKGQIDALNGIIKYKLEKNSLGEEVWVKIEEVEGEK